MDAIVDNIKAIVTSYGAFTISERIAEVYGGTLGYAREKHVRQALKKLYRDGSISTNVVGVKRLLYVRVEPKQV